MKSALASSARRAEGVRETEEQVREDDEQGDRDADDPALEEVAVVRSGSSPRSSSRPSEPNAVAAHRLAPVAAAEPEDDVPTPSATYATRLM